MSDDRLAHDLDSTRSFKNRVRVAAAGLLGAERGAWLEAAYVDVKSSLQYAMSSDARRSVRKLGELRDRHHGEQCVIIGNGPSLRQMDLSPLRNQVTFGLNRIYLLFPELGFPTTYLVAINTYVVKQFADELLSAAPTVFVSWRARHYLPRDHRAILLRPVSGPKFSGNPTRGVWGGATVTYVALQLAYHMGFQRVVLIGVDHSFTSTGDPHKLVVSTGPDPNHFDSSYFGKGTAWQLPDLELSEVAYRLALERYRADGREILDATVGGKLDVFPKVDFRALVARP